MYDLWGSNRWDPHDNENGGPACLNGTAVVCAYCIRIAHLNYPDVYLMEMQNTGSTCTATHIHLCLQKSAALLQLNFRI